MQSMSFLHRHALRIDAAHPRIMNVIAEHHIAQDTSDYLYPHPFLFKNNGNI